MLIWQGESGYAAGRVEQLQDGMVHVKLDGQQQDRISERAMISYKSGATTYNL